MHDDTGAHHAPDGRSRSILPAVTGGLATLPRAPGPDQPPATAGQDRLCAALRVPGHVRPTPRRRRRISTKPRPSWPGVAGADRLCAAPLASGPLRPRHAQKAPGSDQPPATAGRTACAPRLGCRNTPVPTQRKGRRIRTRPRPSRPGSRVLIVCAPRWPPQPAPTAPPSCPRCRLAPLPGTRWPPGRRQPPSPSSPRRS